MIESENLPVIKTHRRHKNHHKKEGYINVNNKGAANNSIVRYANENTNNQQRKGGIYINLPIDEEFINIVY